MYIEGCVTLPDPENGDVHINGVMVGDLYIIGSQATYVCDKGFELYPVALHIETVNMALVWTEIIGQMMPQLASLCVSMT